MKNILNIPLNAAGHCWTAFKLGGAACLQSFTLPFFLSHTLENLASRYVLYTFGKQIHPIAANALGIMAACYTALNFIYICDPNYNARERYRVMKESVITATLSAIPGLLIGLGATLLSRNYSAITPVNIALLSATAGLSLYSIAEMLDPHYSHSNLFIAQAGIAGSSLILGALCNQGYKHLPGALEYSLKTLRS